MGTRQKKKTIKKTEPKRGPEKKIATTIVRIAGKDVDGGLPISDALRQVKGIGHNLADSLSIVISNKLSIPRDTKMGELKEDQLAIIEKIIKNPIDYGIPHYMVNFRKNPKDGQHVHLISNDLVINTRNLIQNERAMKTWRGYRHGTNKGKVRGQKTRRTGRRGLTVGVIRKKTKAGGGK